MNNIQTIRERRANVVAQMRGLTDAATSEERDLSDDESGKFDKLKGQLGTLENQLQRAQVVTEAERSMQAEPNRGSFAELTSKYSVTRAIQAQLDARATDCGLELEISRELELRTGRKPRGIFMPYEVAAEKRDVLASGSGGNLVPSPLAADRYIEPLRIQPQVVVAGGTVLDGLVGDVDIPRGVVVSTTTTVAEHGQVTESTPTFDQVQLRPKTIGAYVELSRRMLINSTPSIERLIRSDLSASLNVEVDRQALIGTGTSNEATGIVNQTGVTSVAFAGAPTWAKVQTMIGSVGSANAEQGRLGFAGNSRTRKELLGTLMAASTDSRHITEDPNMLAGYSFFMANNLPGDPMASPTVDGTLIYGNWTDLVLGFWSGIDLLLNPYHTSVFDRGGALLSAFMDFDAQLRHGASFAAAEDITLTV